MAKQTSNTNRMLILWIVCALIVGGIIGYIFAQGKMPSSAYLSESGTMMKNRGSSMMQMGQMMMNNGKMMQEKGTQYGDNSMMQQGKELEEKGSMMSQEGTSLEERGNGMMQMMER